MAKRPARDEMRGYGCDRRWLVVDRQKGIAFAFVFFDHAAGSARTFKLSDGRDITTGPTRPFTWEIGEMFKVRGNKIHEVEAAPFITIPYGLGDGWTEGSGR